MMHLRKYPRSMLLATAIAVAVPAAGLSGQYQTGQQDQQARQEAQQRMQQQQGQMQGQQGQVQFTQEQKQQMTEEFVEHAAQINLFEVQAGELVQQKAQNPQIKQFAQRVAQAHQQAQQRLEQAAQQAGIDMPDSLSGVAQARLEHLQEIEGPLLDAHYIFDEAGMHLMAVHMFACAEQHMEDQGLKQYAQQVLPTLQQHLWTSQQLASQISGFDGMGGGPGARTAGAEMRDQQQQRPSVPRPGQQPDQPQQDRPDRPDGM